MKEPLKLSEDLIEFVELLSSNEVEFLLVGGHAVAFYGRARYTEDLDLFLRKSEENCAKLHKALLEFGFPIDANQLQDFCKKPRAMISLGVKPNQVELLNFLDGVNFEEAYERRQPGFFGRAATSVISLKDLLETKQTVGRPQDLADLDALKKINQIPD
jgi:hypothetical protein